MKPNHVLLAVTGGIAVYKVCGLTSQLVKQGYDVKVMMTRHATEFVQPLTFEALSHNKVYTDMFLDAREDPIPHISLAEWADVIIMAPATANSIAKMVYGLADDLISTTLLAAVCPILIAPAMNTHMLENKVTQRNLALAAELGCHILEPDTGHLACMESGKGRLPEAEEIIQAMEAIFQDNQPFQPAMPQEAAASTPSKGQESVPAQEWSKPSYDSEDSLSEAEELMNDLMDKIKPLARKHVLISAGPTQEAMDPVRFLTNHSSGKQGYAIAKDAKDWGAEVILVSGPVSLEAPVGVQLIPVQSAVEMEKAMLEHAAWADYIIMAAAVADYRPAEVSEQKIKKAEGNLSVEFVRNPDILKELGARKRPNQVLCGFAMETQDLDKNARKKLESKNCDMLIANNLSTVGAGFATDTNVVSLLRPSFTRHLPIQSKEELGYKILSEMQEIEKGLKKE